MNGKNPNYTDIARCILNLGFWKVYGEFDIVAAMKRAFDAYESNGYIFVQEIIEIVRIEAARKKWIEHGYDVWFI